MGGSDRRAQRRSRWVWAWGVLAVLLVLAAVGSLGHRDRREIDPGVASGLTPAARSPTAAPSVGIPVVRPAPAPGTAQDLGTVEGLKTFELEVVEGLLRAFPANPQVIGLAGSVYNSQGDHARAVAYWEELLKLDPGEVRAYDAMAQIALLREEHSKALDLWRQAEALEPNLSQVHYHLGQVLMLMGDPVAAIREFELDIEAAPQASESYSLAGQLCRQLGFLERAKSFFEREIVIRPDSAKAHYGLSTVCAQLGEDEAAERFLETFKALKVRDAREDQDARSAYDDLQNQLSRVARTCTAAGEICYTQGDGAAADSWWRQAAAIDTNDVISRVALATVRQRRGQLAEALPVCQELIRIEPENALRHLNLGVLQAQLQHFADAAVSFQRVCELAPDRPEGYRLLAQMKLEMDSASREALPLARRAVALEPGVASYLVLGRSCAAAADWPGARRAVEQVLALDPQNAQARALYDQLLHPN